MTPRRKAEKEIIAAVKACSGRLPAQVEKAYQAYKETWKRKPSKSGLPKTKGVRELMKEAKEAFQKLRRLQEMDEYGMVTCVTCNARMHWKEAQGGHWIPAVHRGTCFTKENVHPQCPKCNMGGNGDHQYKHEQYIRQRYSDLTADMIRGLSKVNTHYTPERLRGMIYTYNKQIQQLEK